MDVAIVGGGIAGLTVARELSRAGLRTRLFERDERCGGLIRTDRIGAFTIDPGPDTLLAHKPAGIDLCRELGLAPSFVEPLAPRTTYVTRNGRLCALPDASLGFPTNWSQLFTTRAFTTLGKLRMALEPLIAPDMTRGDESIGSFVQRRFGNEALKYLAEPLLAGIHRGEASRLSVHALFPALVEAERKHGSVVLAGRLAGRGTGSASVSLATGLHELVDRLGDSLPTGVVTTNSPVAAVEFRGSPVIRFANGTTVGAAAVVLAVPAPAAAELIQPLDAELADCFRAIRFLSAVTVALGYPRAAVRNPLRGWGCLVPAVEDRRVSAASWVSSKWPDRTPSSHVLIRASLGGHRDLTACAESDETLIAWAHDDLRALLRITGAPTLARVYRWPRAIPQLEVGHSQRLAAIERRLEAFPELYITGSGYRGVGISDCITDARAVAARVVRNLSAASSRN